MTLLGPNPEDLRKLHAEVNQLVNQRFLLTTAAITVFGVGVGWMIARPTQTSGSVGAFTFLLAIVLSALLLALFLLSHYCKGMMRIFTTYLQVTKQSTWEQDWSEYKKGWYLGYTKPQTAVFVLLNGATVLFPFLLAWLGGLECAPAAGWITSLTFGVITEALMCGIGFGNWWDRGSRAEERWKAIKATEAR